MSIEQFISGFLGASPVEIIAAISGFICVYLIICRSIWCWFFGFIQVSLYTYVFFGAKLYSDLGLHIIYMGLQVYGWWNWRANTQKNTQTSAELVIQSTSLKDLTFWWLVVCLATIALGFIMDTYTDATFAYPDAFTTSASLVAQWLLSRRHLYNWIFWIVVDVVAIVIYFQKGLYPTSVLYFTLLIMCFVGQYQWYKQFLLQTNPAKTNIAK